MNPEFAGLILGPAFLLRGWLLLGHTVHGAEPPDKVAGINRDDLASREERCQRVQGDAIVRIVEHRYQQNAIRDVEIRIARGQAASLENDWARHGKLDDVEWLAILIVCGLKTTKIVPQRFVIRIFRIVLDHGDDGVRRDEPREVIDVAVSIVAEDAAAQPDHVRRTEIISEDFFVVFARHAGIALLHFAEQTLFGGEERALSVDVDRAAFEDDTVFFMERADLASVGDVRHKAADFFVVTPVGIFCPGIEAELCGEQAGVVPLAFAGEGARATRAENASGVAQPDAVGRPAMEADIFQRCVTFIKTLADFSFRRDIANDQLDALVSRQIANDLRIDPRDRLKFPRPIAVVVGPCKPGRGVRLPFGGHAVVEGCRGNT